ncbi:hypothetical protein [Actinoplanes rectilineatus]|uniref:hypothetical protein n=1 Tax=Actinoplanes rectilineatus TaxID=113571 RepID=UPI000A4536AA|nr:hypothetical protein [Actinoplanes rectilineatus]
MDPLLSLLGPALTLLGVVAAAYFTYRGSNRKLRSDAGQQMIDQHQEEIAALRGEVADLRRTQRIQGDYIGALRRHIADGQPPPPPAWPEGLIT